MAPNGACCRASTAPPSANIPPKLFPIPRVRGRVWKRVRADGLRVLFLAAMTLGAAFIVASSLAYFDLHELPPFAIEKLPVRFSTLWLASLRIHVTAALVSLPL